MDAIEDKYQYHRLFLNPNEENILKSKDSTTKAWLTTSALTFSAKDLYTQLINNTTTSNPYTEYDYADASSIGNFDATQLKSVIEEYMNKLAENSEVSVPSTGMYETSTTVVSDTEEIINVEIDDSQPIKVSITAALIENIREDSSGNILYDIVPEQSGIKTNITKTKSYDLKEIQNGVDSNLKYSNGKIIWYLRNEYSSEKGLASQVMAELNNNVKSIIDESTQETSILKVQFEYYIKEKK